jgi:hypothetical protein
MSRIRLKYVHAFVDHGGRPRHYFRRKGFPRVPLPGLVGSAEFMRAYENALATATPVEIGAMKRSRPGSLSAAIAAYYGSLEFRALNGGTPAKRRAILERFRDQHGDKPMPPAQIHRARARQHEAARGAQLAQGDSRADAVLRRARDDQRRPDARHQGQDAEE